jgi:hypothetical protein
MCVPADLTEDPSVTCSNRFETAIRQLADQVGIEEAGSFAVCELAEGALDAISCTAVAYEDEECEGSDLCENDNLTRRNDDCPAICDPVVCRPGENFDVGALTNGDPSGIDCNVPLGCEDADITTPLCRPADTGSMSEALVISGAHTGSIDRSSSSFDLSVTAEFDLGLGTFSETGSGSTSATGHMAVYGLPCPGESCDVAVEFDAWDSGLTLVFPTVPNQAIEQLWISGGSAGARVPVDAAGNGLFPANSIDVHARGIHDGTVFESLDTNPNPVPFHIDWAAGTLTIPSTSFSANDASGTFALSGSFAPSIGEVALEVPTIADFQNGDFDLDGVPNAQDPCPYFVLWGRNSLVVRDRAEVLTAGAASVLSGVGPTEIFHDTTLQNILVGGSLTLRDGANVLRAVAAGPLTKEDEVDAPDAHGSQFGFFLPVMPTIPAIAVSGQNRTFFANATLSPGTFISVTVSPNVTVTLTAGTYQMGSLVVHPQGRLRVVPGTFLRVRDAIQVHGTIEPVDPAQLGARLDYAGANVIHLMTSFTGTVRAPNAKLVLGQNTTNYQGTFMAKDIEVLSDANVLCNTFGNTQAPQFGPLILRPSERPPGLSVGTVVTSDWGGGYCMDMNVTNTGAVATTTWSVSMNMNGTSVSSMWNLNRSGNTGTIQITPGDDPLDNEWIRVIPPGGTTHSLGLCANRSAPGTAVAQVVSATPTF